MLTSVLISDKSRTQLAGSNTKLVCPEKVSVCDPDDVAFCDIRIDEVERTSATIVSC